MKRNEYIEEILTNFGVLKRSFHAQFSDSCDELGVSMAQLHLLLSLGHFQPVTQSELARKMCMTSGAITQLVEPLVASGFLSREADASDRRVSHISLTSSGHTKVDSLKSRQSTAFKSTLSVLTDDELATFLEIEQKIIGNINKASERK